MSDTILCFGAKKNVYYLFGIKMLLFFKQNQRE